MLTITWFVILVGSGSAWLLSQSKESEVTQETSRPTSKVWPSALCHCVCNSARRAWSLTKTCYGKLKRICCGESPELTKDAGAENKGYSPMNTNYDDI